MPDYSCGICCRHINYFYQFSTSSSLSLSITRISRHTSVLNRAFKFSGFQNENSSKVFAKIKHLK